MTDKTNNERMNEAHVRAAEIILEEMEEVRNMGSRAQPADKADMLAKLGSVMYGLRVNPEPFDPRSIAGILATPFAAPGTDGGKGGNLA